MKKIVAFFMCFAMFVLSLPFAATAASVMTIKCESITAKAGDNVSVDLKTENNPGFTVLNIAIIYDTDNLELTGITNGISGFILTSGTSPVWDGGSNYTSDGSFATLNFKVKETAKSGDYEIKIRFFEASDYDGNDVDAVTVSGKITVKPTVLYGDVDGNSTVDATDLVRLKKKLAGQDVEIYPGADCTGDTVIDATDLVRLKKYLAGQPVVLGK